MDRDKRNPAVASGGVPKSSAMPGRHHQGNAAPARSGRTPSPTYSWRLMWRREGWVKDQVRHFERESAARKHIDKLLGGGRPDLEPLAFIRLERRPVGVWREVDV